ncbi:MAG TPA: hypothetical protein VMV69_02020 [Pirellulales bacterium]|nr:hypothetical protein [Pirellulales bacterium]
MIDLQDRDRRATYRRARNEHGPMPFEMLVPQVGPRSKQPHDVIRDGVNSRDIGSLEVITIKAGQSEDTVSTKP